MNRLSLLKNGRPCFLFFLLCFFSLFSCVSHLKEAKLYYAQGEKQIRQYQTKNAISSFKRALSEAKLEVEKHPSAQAYMVKGMAELNLEMWREAEDSFLNALSFGFEKGKEWAQELSLLGLASTLEELGIEEPVLDIYARLLDTSKLEQVTVFTAQKYMEMMLESSSHKQGKEKQKVLVEALKTAERLTRKDLSCGFYHYLESQVLSHLTEYNKSFEEAVIAKELGLPTAQIFRDNDLQIVFCYEKLKEKLSKEEWEDFRLRYERWMKKWNWQSPETPVWKREGKHAADN